MRKRKPSNDAGDPARVPALDLAPPMLHGAASAPCAAVGNSPLAAREGSGGRLSVLTEATKSRVARREGRGARACTRLEWPQQKAPASGAAAAPESDACADGPLCGPALRLIEELGDCEAPTPLARASSRRAPMDLTILAGGDAMDDDDDNAAAAAAAVAAGSPVGTRRALDGALVEGVEGIRPLPFAPLR
eukprot:5670295-Prymnesium_polylepis.1